MVDRSGGEVYIRVPLSVSDKGTFTRFPPDQT